MAAAICWRAQTVLPESKKPSAAIAIHVETRDGFCARVMFPFYGSAVNGLVVEKPFARRAAELIFRAQPGSAAEPN